MRLDILGSMLTAWLVCIAGCLASAALCDAAFCMSLWERLSRRGLTHHFGAVYEKWGQGKMEARMPTSGPLPAGGPSDA